MVVVPVVVVVVFDVVVVVVVVVDLAEVLVVIVGLVVVVDMAVAGRVECGSFLKHCIEFQASFTIISPVYTSHWAYPLNFLRCTS